MTSGGAGEVIGGELSGGPDGDPGAGGGGLDPRVIEAARLEDEEDTAGVEDLGPETDPEAAGGVDENGADGLGPGGVLRSVLEAERGARLAAELRLRLERAAHAAGAVDAEAVSSLVMARASTGEADAGLDASDLVEAVRAEKPSLFAGWAGGSGSGTGSGSGSGSGSGLARETLSPALGFGGAGLSATGPGSSLDALATRARSDASDRRALLRYLRARRGV